MCARVDRHAGNKIQLRVWNIQLVGDLVVHALVPGVACHADDFDIHLGTGIDPHADVPANGARVAKIAGSELLVDDSRFGSARDVFDSEIAAQQDGNLERLAK